MSHLDRHCSVEYNHCCSWHTSPVLKHIGHNAPPPCTSLKDFTWLCHKMGSPSHYSDVMMGAMASQITRVSIVCLTVCSGVDQRKHHIPASLAFVGEIQRWPVDSPSQLFLFDDVIVGIAGASVWEIYPLFTSGLSTHRAGNKELWLFLCC